MRTKLTFRATLAILSCLALVVALPSQNAQAVTGSDWEAGNIIDDSVFTDDTSMSVQQIQSFLDSQIGTCDTNGTQPSELGGGTRAQYGAANGNPAPFTCLNGYYEVPKTSPGPQVPASNYGNVAVPAGAVSAAQLIANAAQTYDISPAVLLVKLATESAGPLTSDDWPFKKQYLYAMGAYCPDSGPGGSANCDPNYAGFSIQILESAKLLRGYLNNMTQSWWSYKKPYQNNHVLWNVVERGCGGANVFIQNKATAALYTYTPYQPNQAALNNLYGTGDNCSAYGNRNFWRVFNDWFGSLNRPLVRTEASAKLYYVDGTTKHAVNSMEVINEFGLGLDDVRFVSQAYLDTKASASAPFNYLIKSTSDSDADGGNLYLVSAGKRHKVVSMSQLTSYGLSSGSITYLPYSDLLLLPLQGSLQNFVTKSNGFTFQVINSKKSAIFQPSVLSSLNPSGQTSKLSDYIISTIPATTPTITGHLYLVDKSNGTVWSTNGTNWSYIPTASVMECQNVSSPIGFSPSEVLIGTSIGPSSCVLSHSDGSEYIMNKSNRYASPAGWGLTGSPTVSDTVITSKTLSSAPSDVFKTDEGQLYLIESGVKRYVTSMSALSDNALSTSVFTSIDNSSLNSIPTGHRLYQDSSILKDTDNGSLYIVQGDSLLYINSMAVFNAYGLNAEDIVSLSGATIDRFTVLPEPLKVMASFNGTTYIANEKSRIKVTSTHTEHFVSGAIPSYPERFLKELTKTVDSTRYIKSATSAQLYIMDQGTKRPVNTWSAFTQAGGTNNNITIVSTYTATLIPTGTNW